MWRILVPGLALLALPALADTTGSGRTIDCYCTDSEGRRVELGVTICLHVDGRTFTAQCQMSLNNPMWRDLGGGCLMSGVAPELGEPALDARLVHAEIGLPEAQPRP